MSTTNTTYLITGANRGLGRGLVATYLARPASTIIAGVRDPAHPTAQSLYSLSVGTDSALIVVRIDSSDAPSAAAAISLLATEHSITRLDVVIANAGIGKTYPRIADATLDELDEHIRVNAYGPLALFQAALPALNQSSQPKFVALSSAVGSIGGMGKRTLLPHAAYGPSKALLNWLVRRMHFEHENMIVFPIHPGWAKTEMGNGTATKFGLGEAEVEPKDSVAGMIKVIDGATREETSGRFMLFNGEVSEW
ncbi:uncharacterized protein K452DRAFT_236442 [Aplosporella prunicola CBS 121167]|uniref:Aflatoxin biosynthesis ketoreductase nor-1 n=1 Tax=Aplosporella prunicola CBS 121167 TaxID=1176127 RepID=A0A6A6AYV5_9PEZI|nr:uncharacterized protein K452DRAFT_236442 [Aplosporella prunicola CBS 121167]KAF2137112.1 hypothetical protein K452DRAFT_236442 [Aplosporella prunicola CBS 121167]